MQTDPLWACLHLFQGKVLSPRTLNTTHDCLGTYLLPSTEGKAEGSLNFHEKQVTCNSSPSPANVSQEH